MNFSVIEFFICYFITLVAYGWLWGSALSAGKAVKCIKNTIQIQNSSPFHIFQRFPVGWIAVFVGPILARESYIYTPAFW